MTTKRPDAEDTTSSTARSSARSSVARSFLLITVAGALQSWEVGFEYGAFETVSYRKVFAVFVVCSVVFIGTLVANDESFVTSWPSRVILALPLMFVVADLLFLTDSSAIVTVFAVAVLVTLPYALFVVVRIIDTDYFALPRNLQAAAVVTILLIGIIGLYVGATNDRFLTCEDFERIGDYQPDNCAD